MTALGESTRRRLFALGVLAVAALARLAAHPTATTTLIVTFGQSGRVEVGVDADADPLLAKLAALAGEISDGAALEPSARTTRLASLHATLMRSLSLTIDGTPASLAFAGIEDSSTGGAPRVLVRFSSIVPTGARQFAFHSSLVFGSYPLVVRRAGVPGESIEWLQGSQSSPPGPVLVAPPARWGPTVWRDVMLGFTHIVPNGLDHILFVLGLFLLSASLRSVLAQVSVFTLAHSITLGLTLYGVVSLPPTIVEPLIAVSIVYVACENLFTSDLKPWRLALVFAFGLLHGMGFADALARLNLARADFLTTLVSFNVGVEAGQLSIIAAAALVVWAVRVSPTDYRRLVVRPCSVGIALIGAFWVAERLM